MPRSVLLSVQNIINVVIDNTSRITILIRCVTTTSSVHSDKIAKEKVIREHMFKHRHARRARVIFCDLKAPGGCSTRWTHKGNSFMCTGVRDCSQCHYKV